MRIIIILATILITIGCAEKKEPVLTGEPPAEFKSKLVYQEGHIPYYFPELEEYGSLSDGIFIGELNGSVIDRGKVSVEIVDSKISNVEIIDMKVMAPKLRMEGRVSEILEGLPFQVVKKQTGLVDTVSAATGSTHVFKICVTRALWKSADKIDPMLEFSPY